MDKLRALPNVVGKGGAYFSMQKNCLLSFGVEVEMDYPQELIGEYEVTRIQQSKYVVFNYLKYPIDKHGDAIRSTWGAQQDYDIEAQGLSWDFEHAPVFEDDDEEMGYILWFPACDTNK